MNLHRSYWLIFLFCISGFILNAQTNSYERGWIYIKLDQITAQGRQSNVLNLSDITGVQKFEPLRKNVTALRSEPSILDGLYKVQISSELDIQQLCDNLEQYSNVFYAEPIHQEELLYIPNDPAISAGSQDYLDIINAYTAWDITRGDTSMIIGISDTGVDYFHPDLVNKMYVNEADPPNGIDDDNNGYIDDYRGYDFADNDTSALPGSDYHGTRVAGIAGAEADNGFGMAGVGINLQIGALKIFKSESGSSSNAYESIIYAADNGFDVINLSWGSANSFSLAAQDIINYAVNEKDLIIVGAAGNTPQELDFYPASYDNVLSVASTELNDTKASFSTFSYHVDISAPGRSIYGTTSNNGFTSGDGTSFSSPMVAATAGLVRSRFPELTSRQVIERIRVTADKIDELNPDFEGQIGFGRLNMERALSASSDTLKSIRIKESKVYTDLGNSIYFGDSIFIDVTIINYLADATPQISLASSSEYLEYGSTKIQSKTLKAFDETTITLKARISDNTPANTSIPIEIIFEDEYYLDHSYVVIQTNSDRADLQNGVLGFTTGGNGNLGYSNDGFFNGLGLSYNGINMMSRIGFFVSIDSNQVSDNFYLDITSGQRHADFNTKTLVKPQYHGAIDFFSSSTFADDSASMPAGINIQQRTLMDSASKYVIQEYFIGNTGSSNLENLSIGLFTDWDLNDAETNKSYYNDTLATIISYDSINSLYVGITSYYDRSPIHQAIDQNSYNNNQLDITTSWTDSLIHLLSTQSIYDSAGWSSGNDIASMISDDSVSISSGAATKRAFIIAFANSIDELANQLDSGKLAYELYLGTPLLYEEYFSCLGASLTINPQGGDEFEFFTDPFGTNVIATGDTLITGSISQDTSYYLRKLDDLSIGDIYRLDISLVDQVANFSMSTDTLFLDANANSISLTDRSFLPTDWLWDFGNNQQATLQNPIVGYATPGTYTITLQVNNELGCTSSISKELLVAVRPDLPAIEDLLVCSGASPVISASNTDSLAFYITADDESPIYEGQSLQLNNLSKDTLIYITNTSGPYESLKLPLNISTQDYAASFTITVDTTQQQTSAILINTTEDIYESEWTLDETIIGTSDTLTIEVSSNSLNLGLTSTSSLGCQSSISQIINLTASEIPSITNQVYCYGEDAMISPENGQYFAFYSDAELSQFLEKGTSLKIDSLIEPTSIYVTGIDKILPSEALEINITPQLPEATILSNPDTLYLSEGLTVTFTLNNNELESVDWFVNGEYFDNTFEPIVLFQSEGIQSIKAVVKDADGCSNQDSLVYQVLKEREIIVLGDQPDNLLIYPNPANKNQSIFIKGYEGTINMSIFNVEGKLVFQKKVETKNPLDISFLSSGNYTIILESEEFKTSKKLIIR
ncbi:S8 family serine peptidase [Marinoscillum pacificum]|uniref:S8 family serine peptidase n=1 Tax=Marinoscillum pacificum TaxID=392723 RepID=UPI002157578D|nr:S8 family serine peptidase [Marinoscillum pacificum]